MKHLTWQTASYKPTPISLQLKKKKNRPPAFPKLTFHISSSLGNDEGKIGSNVSLQQLQLFKYEWDNSPQKLINNLLINPN